MSQVASGSPDLRSLCAQGSRAGVVLRSLNSSLSRRPLQIRPSLPPRVVFCPSSRPVLEDLPTSHPWSFSTDPAARTGHWPPGPQHQVEQAVDRQIPTALVPRLCPLEGRQLPCRRGLRGALGVLPKHCPFLLSSALVRSCPCHQRPRGHLRPEGHVPVSVAPRRV